MDKNRKLEEKQKEIQKNIDDIFRENVGSFNIDINELLKSRVKAKLPLTDK